MSITLAQTIARAQADANRSGETLGVFNLNRIGAPLYVIRPADSFPGEDRRLALVEPRTGLEIARAIVTRARAAGLVIGDSVTRGDGHIRDLLLDNMEGETGETVTPLCRALGFTVTDWPAP